MKQARPTSYFFTYIAINAQSRYNCTFPSLPSFFGAQFYRVFYNLSVYFSLTHLGKSYFGTWKVNKVEVLAKISLITNIKTFVLSKVTRVIFFLFFVF